MSGTREPLVEVRELTKQYLGVRACDEVSLSLYPGEVVGLVGKNGAGKSTLIKMLAGAVKPDGGEIRICGQEVRVSDAHHANRLGLAFVHQELLNVPCLSVAENVELGLGYPRKWRLFVNQRKLQARSAELLARLEADIDPGADMSTLTIAQQRIVSIARALALEARLIVLDEPSASLTFEEVDHLHAVVRRLRAQGVGVVYVSHRLEEILTITDRVVVMRDARVVAEASTASLDSVSLVEAITGETMRQEAKLRRLDAELRESTEAAEGQELLAVEHLSRSGVIDDISFSLREGEILGIAGLGGSGRSELLRLIFGADRPTAGSVRLKGKVIKARQPADALRAGIAMVPEDRHTQGLLLESPVAENITLASLKKDRWIKSLPFPSRRREASDARVLMEQLAIRGGEQRPVKWLSGGNQQKVVLAKWLHHGADVFLFDDPTHGVDIGAKREMYELMWGLAAEGKGVVFVSSEFAELVEVCPRVLILREGRLAGELRGADLDESALVDGCYAVA